MATDPRKRQKKLEKQKAKRKAKHHQLVKERNAGLGQRLARAAAFPVLECLRLDNMFEQGMGQVIVSRQLPDGGVAVGVFLVDLYCLGVKDAFAKIASRYQYDTELTRSGPSRKLVAMDPPAARKLVEGAVAYAQNLGIAPHPDYQTARLIFGDIDATQCAEEFEYGRHGKPYFFAGPHDSQARCRQILATLQRTCGMGNFDYTIPVVGDALNELMIEEDGMNEDARPARSGRTENLGSERA